MLDITLLGKMNDYMKSAILLLFFQQQLLSTVEVQCARMCYSDILECFSLHCGAVLVLSPSYEVAAAHFKIKEEKKLNKYSGI